MIAIQLLCLALVFAVAQSKLSETCPNTDVNKVDCGFVGVDQDSCESKGCCWFEVGEGNSSPWCFYHVNTGLGSYSLIDMHESNAHYRTLIGTLKLDGKNTETYGSSLEELKLQMIYEGVDTFRLLITDTSSERYQVPESMVKRGSSEEKALLSESSLNYEVAYTSNPFTFEVKRKSDGVSLFNMDSSLVYKDQYLEISTTLDTNSNSYGLGESTRFEQALSPNTYTMWAADIPAAAFYKNLYGSFPYHISHNPSTGSAHGAMLMNSNGIDAVLEQDSLTFKAIGGVIDLYIFSGSSPADVVKQYTNVVGKPMMPAYWSLGFHNCKYGYSNISEVESVVKGYQEAQIPLDTQWFDIDYMQSWRDFTYDSLNFPVAQVKSFVDNLHTQGMHFVPIIDPGIEQIDNYTPYQDGIDSDIYVKDLNGDKPYLGQVWPGPVGFPDWFNPKTSNYWYTQLNKWWDMANFDGLWIDMNEVSNFCNEDGTAQVCENTNTNCPTGNLDTQTTCCLSCQQVDASNQYDFPPYRIHNQQSNGNLGSKTMAPSSIHYDNMIDYNVHNLYGLGEQIATYEALTTIRKERPFLLTRSSFLSSGAHTAKWTGDNAATWDDLRSSIVSIMDFSLFGIPMLGADICGFLGDTTEELCSRWIEVGAFYPFSRNHNSLGQKPQELYLWDTVKDSAQKALGIRYQILPYLYTLFYKANTSGDTVTRALWMNFPNDVQASKINYQFMLGKAIMVSPVVYEGATSVDAYFPQNYWYDFESLNVIDASSSGMTKTLDTPLSTVNVHIKGGNILPLQGEAMTTTEARTKPYSLIVALCDKGKAWGDLFIDDGISTDLTQSLQIAYEATLHSLTATITEHSYKGADSLLMERITIISPQISIIDRDDIKLNGVAVDPLSVSSAEGKLYLLMDSLTINKPFTLTW